MSNPTSNKCQSDTFNQCGTGRCLFFNTSARIACCRQKQGRNWDGSCNWRRSFQAIVATVIDDIVYFHCCGSPCAMDLKSLPKWDGNCRRLSP